MSAIGSVSAGAAFAVQALPKKSVKGIPEMAFGKVKWETHFGDIGAEPSLPPNIEEILDSPCPFWPDKKVRETHLLVLVPETVNGKPFNLDALGEMIQAPKAGHKTKYRHYSPEAEKKFGKKGGDSHWVLITQDAIPGSRRNIYENQKALVEKYTGRNGVVYKMPGALEVATAILMEYVLTGTQFYSDCTWTYTRCEEKVGPSRYSVVIGGLCSEGLGIKYYDCTYSCYNSSHGAAACGSFDRL